MAWSRVRARRDERGATVVLVALLMSSVLLVSAAFAVDLGQQRVVRRDMQAVADVAALDLSRLLTDKPISSYKVDGFAAFNTVLDDSIKRNGSSLGDVLTTRGRCFHASSNVGIKMADQDAAACWEFVKKVGNAWQTTWEDGDVPGAIRVFAKSKTDFAFAGVTGVDRGGAVRSAVSEVPDRTLCFNMGSFAAALNLGNSVLGPLSDFLGLNTDLTLISYQKLLAADVSLLDIALSPGIGSPDALLDPSGITVGQLLNGTIYVLQHDEDAGTTDTLAAIDVLQGLLVPSVGLDLDATVVIPDVVAIDAGDSASLAADMNVLDLVGASLAMANGENFLDTDVPIDLTSLGLGTGNISITVIEGPRRACGKPDAHPEDDCETIRDRGGACAAQSQIAFELTINQKTIPLVEVGDPVTGLVSTNLSASVGAISLAGGIGNGKAVLTAIDVCGPPDELTVRVYSGLLGVNLDVPITISGGLAINVGNALPSALQNLVGNVLNLPALLGGLLGGYKYEYRNFRLAVAVADAGVNLHAESEGTTTTQDAELVSPTNDIRTGVPVRVPDPPQAPALDDLSIPGNILSGKITVTLTYEWRRATALASLIQTGPWGPVNPGYGASNGWVSNTAQTPPGGSSAALFTGDLAGLSALPAPLNSVGQVIDGALSDLVSVLNNQVVGTVNDVFNSTLLPLLGLSGTGVDLYSAPRAGTCGGTPRLVG